MRRALTCWWAKRKRPHRVLFFLRGGGRLFSCWTFGNARPQILLERFAILLCADGTLDMHIAAQGVCVSFRASRCCVLLSLDAHVVVNSVVSTDSAIRFRVEWHCRLLDNELRRGPPNSSESERAHTERGHASVLKIFRDAGKRPVRRELD
jgi:hypothetical protein